MKIFVKTLKGTNFEIQVKPEDTVADVKQNIETVQGAEVYPATQQMLIHKGKVLKDTTTLEENNVAENSFIVIMLSKTKDSSSGGSSIAGATSSPTQQASVLPSSAQPSQDPAPSGRIRPETAWESAPASGPLAAPASGPLAAPASGPLAAPASGPLAAPASVPLAAPASVPLPAPASVPLPAQASVPLPAQASVPLPAQASVPLPAPASVPLPAPASVLLAAPASVPLAAPASVPASSESDAYDQAASNIVSGTNLESTIQQILDMGGGSWDRDQVVHALRAAYNNPERAVEYLYSDIPEQPVIQASAGEQVPNPPTQAPQPAIPSSGPNANPLDLFPQGVPNLSTNAGTNNLDFLRNSQQFQALRAMVQANPQILQPMLQELGKQNPQLMRLIQEHQADFVRLVNEPVAGEGNLLEQLAGAMPQSVTVTPEEREAIDRLVGMGFDRTLVLEAYFACNKDEELAANYLLDHSHEYGE